MDEAGEILASVPDNLYPFGTIKPEIQRPIPVPSQILLSFNKRNISLYAIQFILPIIRNFLFASNIQPKNFLNKLNGDL